MSVYVGLDIGGTKCLAAVADHTGQIQQSIRRTTPDDLQEGLDLLIAMTKEVVKDKSIQGIGAAIGGPLDWQTGIVSPLHQPQWRDVPLKDIMESQFKCPFFVDVDTNVAALAEYEAMDIKPSGMLYITLSTGMGGGLIYHGRLYRGQEGRHPEIGHQSIPFRCSRAQGIRCECGASDCLEALVSGNGIYGVYGKPAEALSPWEWDEVAYNLGQGLRNLATLYAPGVIILGGGVALGGGQQFITKAAQVMQEHLTLVSAPKVRLSVLGHNTALQGAVYIAIHGL